MIQNFEKKKTLNNILKAITSSKNFIFNILNIKKLSEIKIKLAKLNSIKLN